MIRLTFPIYSIACEGVGVYARCVKTRVGIRVRVRAFCITLAKCASVYLRIARCVIVLQAQREGVANNFTKRSPESTTPLPHPECARRCFCCICVCFLRFCRKSAGSYRDAHSKTIYDKSLSFICEIQIRSHHHSSCICSRSPLNLAHLPNH